MHSGRWASAPQRRWPLPRVSSRISPRRRPFALVRNDRNEKASWASARTILLEAVAGSYRMAREKSRDETQSLQRQFPALFFHSLIGPLLQLFINRGIDHH